MQNMRLTEQEHQTIVAAVREQDAEAILYLFGSRTQDAMRGGDIDLLVLSQTIDRVKKGRIRRAICDHIGEQKIDIVVAPDTARPFVRMAVAEGIRL